MKVKGKKTEVSTVEIELEPLEALKTLREHCFKSLGLQEGCCVENGMVVVYEENYGGSHSWTDRKVLVECPTTAQLTALSIFSTLYSLIKSHC